MNWHQKAAARRHWRLRRYKAHIAGPDYIRTGRALCGRMDFKVYVHVHDRHNPNNNVCALCMRRAEN